jgi:hypothetical protein
VQVLDDSTDAVIKVSEIGRTSFSPATVTSECLAIATGETCMHHKNREPDNNKKKKLPFSSLSFEIEA